jgi:anti-sigma factor RsiW
MTPREPRQDPNGTPRPLIARPELELMAYLDGELEAERVAAVEERLRTDAAYAAHLHELRALGDFLRGHADRIYEGARLDDVFVDTIVRRMHDAALARPSELPPPTSRITRAKKSAVIWVSFGTVAAAAAALFFYVRSLEPHRNAGNAAQNAPTSHESPTQERVAVKAPALTSSQPGQESPAKLPPPVDESVEIESLEVGQGATVIYTRDNGAANAVVWINANR